MQGVLGRLGFASSGCLLFGLAHPLYLPLLIAAAVWSYGAVIVTQRLLVFGLSLAAKLSGSSNRSVVFVMGDISNTQGIRRLPKASHFSTRTGVHPFGLSQALDTITNGFRCTLDCPIYARGKIRGQPGL